MSVGIVKTLIQWFLSSNFAKVQYVSIISFEPSPLSVNRHHSLSAVTTLCQPSPLSVSQHHSLSAVTTLSANSTLCQPSPLSVSRHHSLSANTTDRQLSLMVVWEGDIQVPADHKLQNSVSEKLQPLVVAPAAEHMHMEEQANRCVRARARVCVCVCVCVWPGATHTLSASCTPLKDE